MINCDCFAKDPCRELSSIRQCFRGACQYNNCSEYLLCYPLYERILQNLNDTGLGWRMTEGLEAIDNNRTLLWYL